MIEIDGARYSGSGTIVRQAVALSALTGKPVHITRARVRRPKPGLRPQHICVVEAIRELVNGEADGLSVGSQEITFRPGPLKTGRHYTWDIGTAGSTTMLASALLPVLAFASSPVMVELRGGLFQDFALSVFHLQHVMLPILGRMGFDVALLMTRPGYVPRGGGVLELTVRPVRSPFRSVRMDERGSVTRVWGISLSSHLESRRVSHRMATTAGQELSRAGYQADIEIREDTDSLQPGAALALFADLSNGTRLGADQAGALRRSAESIGKRAARQLLEELSSGGTIDRFAGDQIVPYAALASGISTFRPAAVTEHLLTNIWLAEQFVGMTSTVDERLVSIEGIGFQGTAREA